MKATSLTLSLFAVGMLGLASNSTALADSTSLPGVGGVSTPTTRQYDKRLPPVLPGEEIVTETGQRMRVWSSSGPVPINPPPQPQQLGGGVPVIVDGRGPYPSQHPPQYQGGGNQRGGR
jgi:hypothetical protein